MGATVTRVVVFVGASAGGWLAWWAASSFGTMTAFMASIVGTAIGIYAARRWASYYQP
jgi:uncharacterized membrane protein YeaQ/YmgE (transglycosylase-associated protein family)